MYISDICKFRARIDTVFEDNEQMYDDIIALISDMPCGETFDTWGDDEVANLMMDYPTLEDDWKEVKKALKPFYYSSITITINGIVWKEDGEAEDLPDTVEITDKEITTEFYEYLNELKDDEELEEIVRDYLYRTYDFGIVEFDDIDVETKK